MDAREQNNLASHWWILMVQGILAILFGILAVFWPSLTLTVFVYMFGIYILIAGVVGLIQGLLSIGRGKTWILPLLLGLLQLGIGLYLVRHPAVSFGVLILLAGSVFVVYGIFGIVAALADKSGSSTNKTLGVIAGLVSLLAGILLFFQPAAGGTAFVWVIGLFSLISGPIWIALSLDVKSLGTSKKK